MFRKLLSKFTVSKKDLSELLRFQQNADSPIKIWLWVIGIVFSSLSVAGALLGYARAYNRFLKPEGYKPDMSYLTPIVRVSMLIFGFIGLVVRIIFLYTLFQLLFVIFGTANLSLYGVIVLVLILLLSIQMAFITWFFRIFERWQIGINNMMVESEKFGTARFATEKELLKYTNQKGLYIGGGYTFSDKGHVLTVAGTRGGKGTNLIIPNLLGVGGYQGSFVVIDPKGENAAITARYQRESGQKVVVLNPWDLLAENIGEAQSYNPLDILSDKNSIHFIDDVQIIAEMVVPIEKESRDRFFSDSARSIISGLILYLMTTGDKETQVLATIWKWVRYKETAWNDLVAEMATCEDEANGETIQNAGNEILKLMKAGDKTFGSIIATVLQATEFLKSPALQKSMESGYSPEELSDGNTTLYVIIPADKLQSHFRWLRLVATTTMRAVVRKPNKRVTFLLDEFAALGYLPEIEVALSTYAGFEITVWAILQSLIQLKGIYSDNWETFTANCTIRQYFTVNDNFTADYVSAAIGQTSHVLVKRSWFGVSESESNARALVTPDEVRRGSGQNIFAFMGEQPPTFYPKMPYYLMGNLIENGKKRYDENPYIKL